MYHVVRSLIKTITIRQVIFLWGAKIVIFVDDLAVIKKNSIHEINACIVIQVLEHNVMEVKRNIFGITDRVTLACDK